MKSFFFLSGLPRAGNTLLAALVNQNPNVSVSANSVLMDVFLSLEEIKSNNHYFQNFPDEKSYYNISKNVFNNYYSDYKAQKIIDRGCWGIPDNLTQIKKIIKKPKFIILYRPILECLASFVKAEKPHDAEITCDYYMSDKGLLKLNLLSIHNIMESNEDYLWITYDELVKSPFEVIRKIFKFIHEENFIVNVNKLKQFSVNGMGYDDSVLSAPLHEIRTDRISKSDTDIRDYLSQRIIDKYGDLDLWPR